MRLAAFAILSLTLGVHLGSTAAAGPPGKSVCPPDEEHPVYYPRADREASFEQDELAPEHLLRQFVNHHTAMRYDEAAQAARALVESVPDQPLAHYNLACALSRLGREGEAVTALNRAVELGWRNVAHTMIDLDLARLRQSGRLDEVVSEMRRLADAERIAVTPLRADPWGAVVDDLRTEAPRILSRYHVPGASIALIRNGRVVWSGAFGLANGRSGEAMTEATAFDVVGLDHLLLLMAGSRLDTEDKLDLGQLLLLSEDLAAEAAPGGRPLEARDHRAVPARFGVTVRQHRATARRLHDAQPGQWPLVAERDDLRKMLEAAIQLAAHESYPRYRRTCLLAPLGLVEPDDRVRAAGHSRLGTPISVQRAADAAPIALTARDAGRLAELLFQMDRADDAAAIFDARAVDRVIDAGAFGLAPLGLAVCTQETPQGTRVQVADTTRGTGCLVRWYPQSGQGVVVMFNSETGGDAALHLAAIALGGG